MVALKTSLGELPLRRAGVEDAGAVFDIMCEAAMWLAARGIDQWRSVATDRFRRFLNRRVSEWPVYLLDQQSLAVATICLQDSDADVWTAPEDRVAAGYVHGLAIRSSMHGKGLGEALLTFAEGEFRARGKNLLRLDCAPGNARLGQYYLRLGFREVRLQETKHGPTRLFEKRIEDQT